MNIKLFINDKIYRGEVVKQTATHVTLNDAITLKNVKVKLVAPYTIGIDDDGGFNFSRDLDYIKLANENPIFSDADKNKIDQSPAPHVTYKLLHGLRSLGLACDSIEEIDLTLLKKNINQIVLKHYNTQVEYIDEDDDLTDEQRSNLKEIISKVFNDYIALLKKSNSLKVILLNWPHLFSEELQFNSFLVSIIPNEGLPDNIR